MENIWNFDLKRGIGHHPKDGGCLMDVVSWFEYGTLGNQPECTCDVIAAYCRNINDAMTDVGRQKLKIFIPRLIGTTDKAVREDRAEYLVWQAIRVFAPFWLDKAGMKNEAGQLRNFTGDFTQARILLKSIEKDASAASAAASSASSAASAYAAASASVASASAAYAASAASAASAAASSASSASAAYAAASAAASSASAAYAASAVSAYAFAAYAAASAAYASYADSASAAYAAASSASAEWEPLMLAALDGALKIGNQAEPLQAERVTRANETFHRAREMTP